MSPADLGTLLGIVVISTSIICGAVLIFASMRSSKISKIQKTREGDENE